MGDRVVVVSRAGCHLCEQAVGVVAKTLGIEQVSLLDIDGDLGGYAPRRTEWSDLVPVILVDGAVHDVIRVNPARLLAALEPPKSPVRGVRGRLGLLRAPAPPVRGGSHER